MKKSKKDSKALGLRFKGLGKIKGVEFDSRKVKPGFVFVAIKGLTHDGHDFISEAIKNGASVVYGENPSIYSGLNYIQVKDSRQTLGELASEFYGHPSKKLKIIGVTGTDGKTTTASMIYWLLKQAGKKVGLITTVSAIIGDKEYDTGFHVTSPDPLSLQKFLSLMVKKGCEYAVIEVTSHGIDQKRIAGVKFDVGVLTNITPEHLDYHQTFAEYRKTKLSFLKTTKIQILGKEKTKINLFPGKFNNLNAQAAIDTVSTLGIENKEAIDALQSFELPIGRLEEIKNSLGFKIYVDFAHTPNALENVLRYLREKTKGKLITVFGCAGERDKTKRARMGELSSKIADLSVFTAEDPRGEDVFEILKTMELKAKNYISIPERGEAIAYALSVAERDDCVVICGKGHERSMAYDDFEHPWSDREIVENFLTAKDDIAVIVLAAGKGKRMNSEIPKVLHEICGRPMIAYSLENLRRAALKEIIVVVSYRKDLVIKRTGGAVKLAFQRNPVGGTADAAMTGLPLVSKEAKILIVINGDDSAFYTPETIKKILEIHKERGRKLTFVSLMKDDPTGLGRVIRGKNGLITKIVEEKDATEEERKIKEVNDGLYVFDRDWFEKNIIKVKKGHQGEYYLVDLVKIAIDQGDKMATYTLPNDDEWQGINTPEQLKEANKKMKERLRVKG